MSIEYVTKTFAFVSDSEGLADGGLSAIAFAYEGSDGSPNSGCVKFTIGSGVTGKETGTQAVGDTWEDWGVPNGATINEVTASLKLKASVSGSIGRTIRASLLSSGADIGNIVYIDADVADPLSWSDIAGLTLPIPEIYSAHNSAIELELGIDVISNTGTATYFIDTVAITIQYEITTSGAVEGLNIAPALLVGLAGLLRYTGNHNLNAPSATLKTIATALEGNSKVSGTITRRRRTIPSASLSSVQALNPMKETSIDILHGICRDNEGAVWYTEETIDTGDRNSAAGAFFKTEYGVFYNRSGKVYYKKTPYPDDWSTALRIDTGYTATVKGCATNRLGAILVLILQTLGNYAFLRSLDRGDNWDIVGGIEYGSNIEDISIVNIDDIFVAPFILKGNGIVYHLVSYDCGNTWYSPWD